MSNYINIEMSETLYNILLNYLIIASENIHTYPDMSELVHLIDFLEDKYQEDSVKRSKEIKKYIEYEKLFNNDPEYFQLFYKVEDAVSKHINIDNTKEIFYLTCELIDIFNGDTNDG